MLSKAGSALFIWVGMLVTVGLYVAISGFFVFRETGALDHVFYFAVICILGGSIWNASIWRAKGGLQASIVAACVWLVATILLYILLFHVVMGASLAEFLDLLKFWQGGTLGLLLLVLAIAPILIGEVNRKLK